MDISLNVTINEVQAVLAGLAKLPLEQSADAFFKIKAQAEQQVAAQQAQAEGAGAAATDIGGTD